MRARIPEQKLERACFETKGMRYPSKNGNARDAFRDGFVSSSWIIPRVCRPAFYSPFADSLSGWLDKREGRHWGRLRARVEWSVSLHANFSSLFLVSSSLRQRGREERKYKNRCVKRYALIARNIYDYDKKMTKRYSKETDVLKNCINCLINMGQIRA